MTHEELCPQCGTLQEMDVSSYHTARVDDQGNEHMTVTVAYHCKSCGVLARYGDIKEEYSGERDVEDFLPMVPLPSANPLVREAQKEGLEKRIKDNARGKFYVTSDCNGCGICFSYALQNFMYSNDSSYYYVYSQPVDEREEADIRRAMEVCPMGCIKDDGDLN